MTCCAAPSHKFGCVRRIISPAKYACCGENTEGCKSGWKCCNQQNQNAQGCKVTTVTKINNLLHEIKSNPKTVYLSGNKTVQLNKFK